MTLLLGLVMVFGLVFGGFMLSGGNMDIVLHALPYEGMMIGGASLGAFVIANSFSVVKSSLVGVMRVIKGPRWKAADYNDLLALMFELARLYKTKGIVAMDEHIENPETSPIFQRYPKLMKDHFLTDLIADSFRMMSMQFDDRFQMEDVLNRKIKKHHHESLVSASAIQSMADGLPAIGIVAAVLGVVKALASADAGAEEMGLMIAHALVGTFLGILLAYGFVNPVASRIDRQVAEAVKMLQCIRVTLLANLNGYAPQLAVEFGRKALHTAERPSFTELEEHVRAARPAGAKQA